MKKNFNLKNIKLEMRELYQFYINSDMKDNSYLIFYDSLRNLYSLDFLSYDEFNKIYEYDEYLFKNIEKEN